MRGRGRKGEGGERFFDADKNGRSSPSLAPFRLSFALALAGAREGSRQEGTRDALFRIHGGRKPCRGAGSGRKTEQRKQETGPSKGRRKKKWRKKGGKKKKKERDSEREGPLIFLSLSGLHHSSLRRRVKFVGPRPSLPSLQIGSIASRGSAFHIAQAPRLPELTKKYERGGAGDHCCS